MRRLAIDTSGTACSIALIDDGAVIASRHEIVGRGHAERLIPWIAELPGGGRCAAITVGCGPGSFTGVRIAVAAARALGFGWGAPVRGVSSLTLIAAASDASDFAVAIEGGHGELFVQSFANGPLRVTGPLQSLSPPDAAAATVSQIVIGNAAAKLVALRGFGEARDGEPHAARVLAVPPPLADLPPTPIYGRAADAALPR